MVRGASSAFEIFTLVEGSKVAFSGRYLKTSVTSVELADEIVMAERSHQAAAQYMS